MWVASDSRFYSRSWASSKTLMHINTNDPLCADILKKYYYALIRKKILRYDFAQITRDNREYLETLIINKYLTTSNLRIVNIKYSGCSKQHRSICISKQHKIINVLQLAPSPQGSRTKLINAQLEIVGKPILFPTLEPDNTSDQKGTPGENNTENYNLVLENCNMVHSSTGTIYPTPTASTSNHNQQTPSKTNDLEITPLILLFETNNVSGLESDIILHRLVKDKTEITNQRIFTEFFKALNESSIRSFIKPENVAILSNHYRYIHILSGLITRTKDKFIPKAQEIGAVLAAQPEASADDIVTTHFGLNI
ncbi:hypothetical protein BB561_000180 [Smittium simulii]|uniref:Uncharacterized protein n=1 Tax=Smittium simulii TaxID=133385 RepID=A0A2T9Z035_9FUNG|nr:hypothetical protein BB561_000180 [Smittium simulii]